MPRPLILPDPSSITATTPLRLDVAAALAYPNGGMTATGLRKERDAGRLVTEFTAGKEYTTLRDIEEMRRACRGLRKARALPRRPSAETSPAGCSNAPSGSSSVHE